MNHPVKNKPPRFFASLWQAAIVMFLLAFSVSGQVNAALTDGLVAYYPFNGNANDESGNNHNGVVNGATLTTDKSGKANSAYSFNGINSYISVNDATDLRASNKVISISLLIKSLSDTQVAAVIRKGISCNIPGWSMDFRPASITPIQFLAWNDLSYSWAWDVSSAENITQGQWRHVVMIADGETATTYLDGKPIGTSVINNSVNIDTDSPMFIGAAPPGACGSVHALYKGDIDEARIYNRALTAAEVTTLYQQGNPPADPNDELSGFIDLNKSNIDSLNSADYAGITFTKPLTALSGSGSPVLGDYFTSVKLNIGGKTQGEWTFADIKNLLNAQYNSVVLPLPDLKSFPDKLVEILFMNQPDSQQQPNVAAKLQAVTDSIVTFTPNAIINSRQIVDTKPVDTRVCNNKQGIKSKCNNLFNSAESGGGNLYSHFDGANFRRTLSHRLVDFDKIASSAAINKFWANTSYGKIPLNDNGRIPLLLIHGWQGGSLTENPFRNPAKLGLWGNSELHYFQHFLDYYLTSATLQKKYHIYLYHYPSYKHVTYNAFILKKLLDEVGQNLPDTDLGRAIATTEAYKDSPKNKLTIVAHSMGGLVARSLIEEYGGLNKPTVADGFMGKLNQLITLDTPHHGSTGSDPSKLLNSAAKDLTTQGAIDLNWDNYDGRITSDEIATINTKYRWLPDKTNSKSFDTAYCGVTIQCNVTSMNTWLLNLNQQFEQNYAQLAKDKYLLYVAWMSDYKKGASALVKNIDNINNGLDYDFAEAVGIPDLPNGVAAPITSALLSKSSGDMTFPFNPLSKQYIPAFYSPEIFQDSDAYFWYAFKESLLPKIGPPEGELFLSEYDLFDSTQSASITRNTQLHSILISKENILNYYEHPYGLPYRVFWDYDHEKMVNGAYLGEIGGWDKFISKNPTVDVSTKASAFYFNSSRNNYISAAFSYSGKPFRIDNTQVYNPLKNEPLYLVLERDLLLPKLNVTQTEIDFGNITDFLPHSSELSLSNSGIGDLILKKPYFVTISGTDKNSFKVIGSCVNPMTTSQTCPLTVTFTPPPTKPWVMGLKKATLAIKSNDRDDPVLNIALKARLK